MRYRGFEIISCPDSGVERYNTAESRDEICDGYFCEVYLAEDDQYANQLDTFCLAEGYEIPDTSDESLDAGIIKYVDENYYVLLDAKAEVRLKRSEELVGRLVCWLGENENGTQLYDTLSQAIGMTDEEIREVGFASLAPYFNQAQYAHTIAGWIIDDGTESTLTGSWLSLMEISPNASAWILGRMKNCGIWSAKICMTVRTSLQTFVWSRIR